MKDLCKPERRFLTCRDFYDEPRYARLAGAALAPSPLSERNARLYDPCYAATAILSESFGDGSGEVFEKWLGVYRETVRGYSEET